MSLNNMTIEELETSIENLNLSIEELKALKNEYSKAIKAQKAKTNNSALKSLKEKVKNLKLSERVKTFYETHDFYQFKFLYESMSWTPGNNLKKELSHYKLMTSINDNAKKLDEIGIKDDFDFIFRLKHSSSMNDSIKKEYDETKTLLFLYNFFQDVDNVIDYQGAFNTFYYMTDRLNNILNGEEDDMKIINKDWNKKMNYIQDNMPEIINYILEYRNSIPNARLCIYNNTIVKTAKKGIHPLGIKEKELASAISFGTTIDRLESKNYEDSKNLIYVPYKR